MSSWSLGCYLFLLCCSHRSDCHLSVLYSLVQTPVCSLSVLLQVSTNEDASARAWHQWHQQISFHVDINDNPNSDNLPLRVYLLLAFSVSSSCFAAHSAPLWHKWQSFSGLHLLLWLVLSFFFIYWSCYSCFPPVTYLPLLYLLPPFLCFATLSIQFFHLLFVTTPHVTYLKTFESAS